MQNGCLWVLITDGVTARICSTGDGMTTPLPMHGLAAPQWSLRTNGSDPAEVQCGGRFFRGGKRLFAAFLAQFLLQADQEDAYEKLVIIAAPRIAAALNAALAPETRARVAGKIVRDMEDCEIPESYVAELRH